MVNPKMDMDIMRKCFIETLPGDEYYTTPHYGFKFRGLNDPDVYLFGQDDHRRPINFFYHQLYIRLAEQYLYQQSDRESAIATLDKMVETVAPTKFGPPVPYIPTYLGFFESHGFLTKIAEVYRDAGAIEKAREWATKASDRANKLIQSGGQPRYDPRLVEDYSVDEVRAVTASILGNYQDALQVYQQMLDQNPNNQKAQVRRDGVRIQQALSSGDTATAQTLFEEALTSYGSAGDQRAVFLLRQFSSLLAIGATTDQEPVEAETETE